MRASAVRCTARGAYMEMPTSVAAKADAITKAWLRGARDIATTCAGTGGASLKESSRRTRHSKPGTSSAMNFEAVNSVTGEMTEPADCRRSFTSASAISRGVEVLATATSSQIISACKARHLRIKRESGNTTEA